MTIHLHGHDQQGAEEVASMNSLDRTSFPAVRQLLTDRGCEDVGVLRSVPNREALGVFRAVSTRDGEAQARDGEGFYALNSQDSQADKTLVEIQFSDGFWMLATTADLEITA